MVEMHQFTRWWKTNLCCDSCFAAAPSARGGKDCGPNTYMNFVSDAPWKATVLTHEAYLADAGINVTPWVDVPGFTMDRALRDFAHMDMLGYGRDFGGALLKSMYLRAELVCCFCFPYSPR